MAKIETSLNFSQVKNGLSGLGLARSVIDLFLLSIRNERPVNRKTGILRMLYSYPVAFIQIVVQRIDVIVCAVDDKVVLDKTDLLDRSGVVVIIAVYQAVDIKKSRGSAENNINECHERKYDREKISDDMLGLLL